MVPNWHGRIVFFLGAFFYGGIVFSNAHPSSRQCRSRLMWFHANSGRSVGLSVVGGGVKKVE